ncbi:MAG: hypothetical protein CME26_08860, partial [Gemmatimonadetes bacterium]|nr:hypothetical protein [Gemmatimonadota bacterium]
MNRSSGRQSPASLESFDAHIRDLNDSLTSIQRNTIDLIGRLRRDQEKLIEAWKVRILEEPSIQRREDHDQSALPEIESYFGLILQSLANPADSLALRRRIREGDLGALTPDADLPPGIVPSPNVRMWDTEGGPVAGKRYTAEQIIGHL